VIYGVCFILFHFSNGLIRRLEFWIWKTISEKKPAVLWFAYWSWIVC